MYWILCASVLFVCSYGLPPPSYLKPCSVSKSFEKCSMEVGRHALHSVAKGDKKYGIPKLDPFNIKLITVGSGTFENNLMDIILTGLSKSIFQGMTYDPKTNHAKITLTYDHINLKGRYVMNGKLLVLPIQGSGDFELDFFNGTNFFSFDLEKEVKDEVTYGKITNAQYDYEVGLVQMNFDNLFNGDKVLGPQTNKFLNENWQDVLKDVDGSLKDAVSKVWELVLGNYFSRIPYKDLFLD